MKVKYDIIADAVYVKVSNEKIAKTLKMEDRFLVDINKKGKVVGIEILDVSSQQSLIDSLKENVNIGIPISIIEKTPVAA